MAHPARSLKLCYVADITSIHVRRWLGYFVNQGHQVVCLSDKPGTLEGVEVIALPSREDLLSAAKKELKNGGKKLKVNKTAVLKARTEMISRVLAERQPDVLHAIFLYFRGWSAALTDYHPFVVTLLGSDLFLPEQHYRSKMHLYRDVLLNRCSLRQADLVTAVNATLEDKAKELSGKDLPSVLIPIGTDASLFHTNYEPERLQALRENLNITPETFVFMSPRQVTPLYNIGAIIESFAAFMKQHTQTQGAVILLIKDTAANTRERQAYRKDLKALADSLGVADALRWVGEVPYSELPLYFNVADTAISVSKTDGMPVTFFDAMACHVPLITGDLPSYDRVIIHGETGLRVSLQPEERLISELTAAMQRVFSDATLRNQLVTNSQQVLDTFGVFDVQMQKMETLYHELADKAVLSPTEAREKGGLNLMLYRLLLKFV